MVTKLLKQWPEYAIPANFSMGTTLAVIVIHLLALSSFWTYSTEGLISFILLYSITAMGITFCFHRLLSHRSFKVMKPFLFISTLCGVLALQGGPIKWCAKHRLHHAKSDKPLDPHSAKCHGFLWSHLFWNFFRHPQLNNFEKLKRLTLDLTNEPILMFFEQYFVAINLAFGVLLFIAGYLIGGFKIGLSLLIWGGFLRIVAVWHVTWCINSVTHFWGYRNYETEDGSRNLWWLSILAMGEGWHNNHHRYQRPARTGHRWFELDPTYWLISLLRKTGLVYNVVPLLNK